MKIAVAGATGRVGRHVVAVLTESGHDAVPMSRSGGVNLISGDGMARALTGVECVIDTATGPSPEQQPATGFFTTATANLHEFGQRAGVARMIAVSIIGCDLFTVGYGAAVAAHERAMLAGPVSNPADPDRDLNESGALLPGPHATLAGPTFAEWLDASAP